MTTLDRPSLRPRVTGFRGVRQYEAPLVFTPTKFRQIIAATFLTGFALGAVFVAIAVIIKVSL